MKKRIGVISVFVVVIAILIGLGIRFMPSGDWDSYEVAKESLNQLESAESYAFDRRIESKMVSPHQETFEDFVLETYQVEIGSNKVMKMEYTDNQVIKGDKREVGKATIYFNNSKAYSDEESQFYHWMAAEIWGEDELIRISESKLRLFIDELKVYQSNAKVSEAEITQKIIGDQYIITMNYKDTAGMVELTNTLYVDKKSKEPVRLEMIDISNGFQIEETYRWKGINDIADINIPKEAGVISVNGVNTSN